MSEWDFTTVDEVTRHHGFRVSVSSLRKRWVHVIWERHFVGGDSIRIEAASRGVRISGALPNPDSTAFDIVESVLRIARRAYERLQRDPAVSTVIRWLRQGERQLDPACAVKPGDDSWLG